jgi:hypothetical protein
MPNDWISPPAPANDNIEGVSPPPAIARGPLPQLPPITIPPVPLPPEVMHILLGLHAELGNLVTYLWHSGHSGETWHATRHCLDRRLRHAMAQLGTITEPRRIAR